jgi:hypothetical protein
MIQTVIEAPIIIRQAKNTISLAEYQKKRQQRRRRVAKRQAKRFPLFAVEFMKDEFPNYDYETFVDDVRSGKAKKKKKGKSPMKRQGRYEMYRSAMSNYYLYKEVHYLEEAQKIRNRMYLPFIIEYRLKGEVWTYTFPSTTSMATIKSMASIKFTSWDELKSIIDEKMRYIHAS